MVTVTDEDFESVDDSDAVSDKEVDSVEDVLAVADWERELDGVGCVNDLEFIDKLAELDRVLVDVIEDDPDAVSGKLSDGVFVGLSVKVSENVPLPLMQRGPSHLMQSSGGQTTDVPLQYSISRSHRPMGNRHMVPFGFRMSGGQVAEAPVHVSL